MIRRDKWTQKMDEQVKKNNQTTDKQTTQKQEQEQEHGLERPSSAWRLI